MKKAQEISSFFYSQYFAEGIRITLGSIIPIIVCALLGEFEKGTLISLGALIIGLSDTPGAPQHRKLGMYYCLLLSAITILITAIANDYLYIMTVILAVDYFFFAMMDVFKSLSATVVILVIYVMLLIL